MEAHADSFTISSGQSVNTEQVLDTTGDIGIVEAGGTIDAPVVGISALAEGVTISNAGFVMGSVGSGFAGATGILAFTDGNTITNSGTIMAYRVGNYGVATAIYASGLSHITNSGTVIGFANGQGSSATGLQGNDSNTIESTGEITASATGDFSTAAGLAAGSENVITNAGLISASAVGDVSSAYGLSLQDAPTPGAPGNIIENSGTIRVRADGAEASAFGIRGYIGNALSNSGLIDVQATGANSRVTGVSLMFDDYLREDTLEITGTVRAHASGTSASSIAVAVPQIGFIRNSGLIESAAVGDAAEAFGLNMIVGGSETNNSGTISSTATGEGARAYGAYMASSNATSLINTGLISARATGEAAESYGVWAGSNYAITNCGTISGGTAAVTFEGTENTLNLCKGSHIVGALQLGESNALNIDLGRGVNAALHYEGSPAVSVTAGPHVVAQGVAAVIDPTGFSAQAEMVTDLTRVISDGVDRRLAAARQGRAPGSMALGSAIVVPTADTAPGQTSQAVFWAEGLGQSRSQGASGQDTGFDTRLGGAMLGVDGQVGREMRAGAFLGASASTLETDTNSQSIDADSYFAGVYAGLQRGAPFLNLAATAGLSNQSSSRKMNDNLAEGGTDHATASYGGTFVSPAATLGADVSIPGAVFSPSLRARYAALFLDDYDEKGSEADLSVDARTVQVVDMRAQLALAVPVALEGGEFALTTRLGADATFVSDSNVDVQLLGETLGFNVGGDDLAQAFAGLDVAYVTDAGTRFFAGAEAGVQDSSTTTAQVTAGFELRL
jgi:uncharacterized protein with beta-barrel porin domain